MIHLASAPGVSTEEQLRSALYLQHEAYRSGLLDTDNDWETQLAVAAHAGMALRIANDQNLGMGAGFILNDENLYSDIAALMLGQEGFANYVAASYDSSRDFWKLVRKGKGGYGWEWDNSLDFDVSLLLKEGKLARMLMSSPQLAKAVAAGLGTGVISASSMNREVASEMGYALMPFVSGRNTGGLEWMSPDRVAYNDTRSSFIHGTLMFADASVAARELMSNPSQASINTLNTALMRAQGSGLLVRTDRVIDTGGLVNVGSSDTPVYVPVRLATGTSAHTITSYAGLRLLDAGGDITRHGGIDIGSVSDSDVVAAAAGSSVKLNWDATFGLNVFNQFTIAGNSFANSLSHLEVEPTVLDYLDTYGTAGVTLSGNMLLGLAAGTVLGEVGSTGYSIGEHLDLRTFQGIWRVDPLNSRLYSRYLQQAPTTVWARTLSGLPGNTPQEAWRSPETWRRVEEYWRATGEAVWLQRLRWALGSQRKW